MTFPNKKGFTIIELLVVISITTILITIVTPNLSKFKRERTLDNTVSEIISVVNKARNDTISSLSSNVYGVHFETNRIVYFVGSTFNNLDASNVVSAIDSSVVIPSTGGINLNGGGSNVIFTRLTGDTTNYGTIVLQLSSDSTRQKTLIINKTGTISSN